jgi:hypothetical protein
MVKTASLEKPSNKLSLVYRLVKGNLVRFCFAFGFCQSCSFLTRNSLRRGALAPLYPTSPFPNSEFLPKVMTRFGKGARG